MKSLYAAFRKINHFFAEISGYLIAVIVVLLLMDTFGYLVRFQIPMMIELAVFTTIAAAYLGLSYTEEIRAHVKVDAVLNRLPTKLRRWVEIIWDAVSVLVIGLTAYAAYLKAIESIGDGEAISGEYPLPLAPIRSIIAVSLFLYGIQILINLVLDFRERREEAD
jgi:TRAP-type C4-dicarboxylate transport system permease small subunit